MDANSCSPRSPKSQSKPLGGRKSQSRPTISGTSEISSADKKGFPQFARLPVELQVKIWRSCIPSAGIRLQPSRREGRPRVAWAARFGNPTTSTGQSRPVRVLQLMRPRRPSDKTRRDPAPFPLRLTPSSRDWARVVASVCMTARDALGLPAPGCDRALYEEALGRLANPSNDVLCVGFERRDYSDWQHWLLNMPRPIPLLPHLALCCWNLNPASTAPQTWSRFSTSSLGPMETGLPMHDYNWTTIRSATQNLAVENLYLVIPGLPRPSLTRHGPASDLHLFEGNGLDMYELRLEHLPVAFQTHLKGLRRKLATEAAALGFNHNYLSSLPGTYAMLTSLKFLSFSRQAPNSLAREEVVGPADRNKRSLPPAPRKSQGRPAWRPP